MHQKGLVKYKHHFLKVSNVCPPPSLPEPPPSLGVVVGVCISRVVNGIVELLEGVRLSASLFIKKKKLAEMF